MPQSRGHGIRALPFGWTYPDDQSGSIDNDVTLEGPAIRVLKDTVALLQQRSGVSSQFRSEQLEREDRPAYPLFALREGLVNAMVHRDYTTVGGSILVEIFSDRLTIQNPGRLPDGWTVDDLRKKHGSRPTNPDIARVFYLRGLMEQLGMGTQKLIDECQSLGAKPPSWEVSQNTVTLSLFRLAEARTAVRLSQRQRRFLQGVAPGEAVTTSAYAAESAVTARQARRELAHLEELGFVEKRGKGRATVYILTPKALSFASKEE